jgi:hypothetical protein
MTPVNDIVQTIAADAGRDPTELPPIYDAIDPDALSRFVESANDDASLEFQYCGNVVTVSGSGAVETAPLAEPSPSLD